MKVIFGVSRLFMMFLVIIGGFAVSSCNEDEVVLNDKANIESVSFREQNIEIMNIEDSNSTINIIIDYGEEINSEDVVVIISSGATISEGTVDDHGNVTGISFTDGVIKTLTVTAQDGVTSTAYDITVSVAKNTESYIVSFSSNGVDGVFGSPAFEGGNSIINVILPVGTTLGVSIVVISPNANINEGVTDNQGNVVGVNFENGKTKTLTVTAQDGESTTTYDITITINTPFISEWTVSDGATVVLPLYSGGVYNFIVNWGDGSDEEIVNTSTASHQYNNKGTYVITMKGKIEGFNFSRTSNSKYMITDIIQWGRLELGNRGGYFSSCKNINITASDSPNLDDTTDLNYMFFGSNLFNGDISNWDVTGVTDMTGMFWGATSFDNGGVALDWQGGLKASMKYMFSYAISFNQDISSWNVSAVKDMTAMFYEASMFDNGGVELNWQGELKANMSTMFHEAISFNQDISAWNVTAVPDMRDMFNGATAFNNGGVALDWQGELKSNVIRMFYEATSFNQDISSWNVTGVFNMANMFKEARSFNNGGVALNWKGELKTNINSMFHGAISFNQDISSWN
ncbi:MAG: BspA family leucine-rich repeat surface protein, partial [Flavobacteriaceae bacterium]|nr:BspA family leucine-rich repeat surface protein [Flavobacteriaceae bacterium]